MRRTLAMGAIVTTAWGQAPPQAPAPVFKARAELVTVPVIVADQHGNHLEHLQKEDFVLLEDGKEQKVAVFEEIPKPSTLPARPPADPNQFSNRIVRDAAPVRLTILVLDFVNTPFESQAYATKHVFKYLQDSVDSSQPTSLFLITRSGLKVVHDFTTDPAALAAALRRVRGTKEVVEQASQEAVPAGTDKEIAAMMEVQRMADQRLESLEQLNTVILTLQTMQQIARYCAGLPGRKAVLWASGGFPFQLNEHSMVFNIAGPKLDSFADVSALYEKTWKDLNQAQVALYPVDVGGLANPSVVDIAVSNPRAEYYSHAQWMHDQTIGTFQTFAEATGGRAFYNTNDLAGAFHKAAADNSSYYLLSYYLDRTDKQPGWHKLAVKVHREGVQVRARTGFFMTKGDQDQDDKTALKIALNSPLDYTAISLTGHWQQVLPAEEPGKRKIVFLLTTPPNFAQIDEDSDNHIEVQFVAVALTETGTPAAETSKTMDGHLKADSLSQIRDHGMDYRGALVLPPGDYTVHFAVVDRLSGRIGSVFAPLKVTP